MGAKLRKCCMLCIVCKITNLTHHPQIENINLLLSQKTHEIVVQINLTVCKEVFHVL